MENSTQNQPIERSRTVKKIVCKYRFYPPDFEAWELLWKLNFLCPRVLMFIWSLLTNSLHMRENIHKCIQHFNPYCSLPKISEMKMSSIRSTRAKGIWRTKSMSESSMLIPVTLFLSLLY
ncbi:60S ribosomal protein L6-like [Iris pallida]|uniref:60S ribosomal protein L6-like n=1 Tax=Iris pallida TaxID=29817 RepID=A0AAX6E1X1_IRIPA|nr:60S ribosomal protein L6-like [Iris pallida]KAJ6850715.1 60S ribosomal protein L6-like [Iris pallida]